MSQIKFYSVYNGLPIDIMGGWDTSLNEFFLTVFEDTDDENVIWDSMTTEYSKDDAFNTNRLKQKLIDMGIVAPKGFWDKIDLQEGNLVYRFTIDYD
jgi:hypothetical protein